MSTDIGKELLSIEERMKLLELENQMLQQEAETLQGQLNNTREELNKLKKTPLIIATVEERVEFGKAVVKSPTGMTVLIEVPDRVTVGERVQLNQHSLGFVGVLPPEKSVHVSASEIIRKPGIKYDQVGGLKEALEEVREAIELPLTRKHLFDDMGITPPKGVLLHGPPGCGKTLLAKAVATETDSTFIRLVGSEMVKKFIGEGAKLVKQVFELAKEKQPSVLFIDEIDAVATKRLEETTGGDREVNRTLMQLLAEMDGFDELNNVRIMGATNRIDILDPAILRPGRFDRIIDIPVPEKQAREEIFRIHSERMKLVGVDYSWLAEESDGAIGAEIKAICTEAGMFAIRQGKNHVTKEDFEKALDKVLGPLVDTHGEERKSYM